MTVKVYIQISESQRGEGAMMTLAAYKGAVQGIKDTFMAEERDFLALLHLANELMGDARQQYRAGRLTEVFEGFDIDESGSVDHDELYRLGAARCKDVAWSEARNKALVEKMDQNQDGLIDAEELVEFYTVDLPQERWKFDLIVDQLLEAAIIAGKERAARNAGLTDDEHRRVRALYVAMDTDTKGSLEAEQIVVLKEPHKAGFLLWKGQNFIAGGVELSHWSDYMTATKRLMEADPKFPAFLTELEALLRLWLEERAAQKAKELEEMETSRLKMSPVKAGWQRRERGSRTPRSPRTPKKGPSKALQVIEGHTDWVLDMQMLPNETLLTASQDNTAKLFDIDTGSTLQTFEHHTASVLSMAITADSTRLYTGSLDGTVCQWDIGTGELVGCTEVHPKGVLAIGLCCGEQYMLTGSRDNSAVLWELTEEGMVKKITYTGHVRWVMCLAAEGDKVYTGSTDATVRRWDMHTGTEELQYKGHSQEVTSLVLHQEHMYTGSREAVAIQWDLTTGACLRQFTGHLSVIRDICIYENRLYTASADGTARCWDVSTGSCAFTLTGHEFAVTSLVLNNNRIFTGSSDAKVRRFAMEG